MLLKSDTDVNNNYNGMNWAYQIQSILQQNGLEFIWNQQTEIEISFTIIKQRILDMYYQKWYAEINNSNRLMSDRIFKHKFVLEKYLDMPIENKYKVASSRIRTSSNDLFIKTGRYGNVPRNQRLCKSCNIITKTCLYNFDPLKPHFYIVKLGYTGVYIIFLISAQNIDCGYALEPPKRGGSNEYTQSMFLSRNMKNIRLFYLNFFIFWW